MKFRFKTSFNFFICAAIGCFGITVFIQSKAITTAVIDSLFLCCNTLIPSLFPFLVVTGFLGNCPATPALNRMCAPLSRVFHQPKTMGAAILLGMVGGYPAGAGLISDGVKNKKITSTQGAHMACCCISAGPSFLVLGIGTGMAHSPQLGWYLLLSHLLATFLCGLLFRPKICTNYTGMASPNLSAGDAFVKSVMSASAKLVTICGFAVIAGTFIAALSAFGVRSTLLSGLIEVTAGCLNASKSPSSGLMLYLCLFTSLSSLSIISQVSAILSDAGVSTKKYILSRPIHALFSCTIGFLLYKFAPPYVETLSQPKPSMFEFSPLVSLILLAMIIYLFCYENILKNDKNLV